MKLNTRYSAFTFKAGSIIRALKTEVDIKSDCKTIKGIAQWDTGASGSCISERVVNELGLIQTGKMLIRTPTGSDTVNSYSVGVMLPNGVFIPSVTVFGSSIGDQGIDMLIGMDIITMGDFAVSNFEGKTVFSFVIPSLGKIDFLPKVKTIGGAMKGHMRKRKKKM